MTRASIKPGAVHSLVARENRAVVFDEIERVLADVYSSDDSARRLAALAHLGRQFRDGSDGRQVLEEQSRSVCAEHYAEHVWVATWGAWKGFVTLDDLHAAYGDGALFMWGDIDLLLGTPCYFPLCDVALINTLVIQTSSEQAETDEILRAAEPVVDRLRGQIPLSATHMKGHADLYLYRQVLGDTTDLDPTETVADQLSLPPNQLQRNCWLLAACIERDERAGNFERGDLERGHITISLEPERPRHPLEAIIIARQSLWRTRGPMRQPMDNARSRAQEMLTQIDPDLVTWARGELNIWADPA